MELDDSMLVMVAVLRQSRLNQEVKSRDVNVKDLVAGSREQGLGTRDQGPGEQGRSRATFLAKLDLVELDFRFIVRRRREITCKSPAENFAHCFSSLAG
jgi:hypothetical protein